MPLWEATDFGVALSPGDRVAILNDEDLPIATATRAFTLTPTGATGGAARPVQIANLTSEAVELQNSFDNVSWNDLQTIDAGAQAETQFGLGMLFRLNNESGVAIVAGTIWVAC